VENLFADALWKSTEAGKTSLSMLFGRTQKREKPLRHACGVTPLLSGEAERKSYYNCFL
jgi:hypothetical protein